MHPILSLFSFDGRLRRSGYWAQQLGAPLLFLLVGLTVRAIFFGGLAEAAVNTAMGPLQYAGAAIILLALVPCYWVCLASTLKRFHDRNKTGWFLLMGLIPFLGGAWMLIALGVRDGSPGPNRYGQSPKFPENAANAFA